MSNQTPSSSSSIPNTPATPSTSNLQGKTKVFILTPDLLKKLGIANKIPNLSTFKVAGNVPNTTPVKKIENNLITNTPKKIVSVLNTHSGEIKNKCDNVEIKQSNAEQNSVKSKLLSMLTTKLQNEPSTSTEIIKYQHPPLFEKQITSSKASSSDPQEIKLLQEKKSEANKLSIQDTEIINLDNNVIDTDSSTINKEYISEVTNLPDSITSEKNIRLKSESSGTYLKSTCSEIQKPISSIKIEDIDKTVKEVNNQNSQKVITYEQNSDIKTEPPSTDLNQKLNTGQTPAKYIKIVKQINYEQPTKSTDILLPIISPKKENAHTDAKSNKNALSPTYFPTNSVNPSESTQPINCTKNNSNSADESTSLNNISIEKNVTINNRDKWSTKTLEENENQIKELKSITPIKIIPENVKTDIKSTLRSRKRKMTTEDEELISPIRKSSRQRRLSTIHSDYVTELKLHDGSSQKISKKERKSTESKQSKDLIKYNKLNEQKSLNTVHCETKSGPSIKETIDLTDCISDNIATQENKQNNSINNKNSHKLIVQNENENAIYNISNNNLQNFTPNSNNEELSQQSDEDIQPCHKKRIIIHENILITPSKTLEGRMSTNLKNILNKNLETKLSVVVNKTENTDLKSSKSFDTKQFMVVSNPGIISTKSIDTKKIIVVSNPDLKSSKNIDTDLKSNENTDNMQLTVSNTDLKLSKTINNESKSSKITDSTTINNTHLNSSKIIDNDFLKSSKSINAINNTDSKLSRTTDIESKSNKSIYAADNTDSKLSKTIDFESKSSKSIDSTQLTGTNTDFKSSETIDTDLKSSKSIDAVNNTNSKLSKTIDIESKSTKSINSTQLRANNTALKSSKAIDTGLKYSKSIDAVNSTDSKLSKTIDFESNSSKSIVPMQLTSTLTDFKSIKTIDTDLKSSKTIDAVNNTESKLSETIDIETKSIKRIYATQVTDSNTDLKSSKTIDTDLKSSKSMDAVNNTDSKLSKTDIESKSSKSIDSTQLTCNNTDLKSSKIVDTDFKLSKSITELKSSKSSDTKQALVGNNTENTDIKTNIRKDKKKGKLLKKLEWEDVCFKVKSPIRTYPVKLKERVSTESVNSEDKTGDNELKNNNSLKSDLEIASSSCETPISAEIIKTENNHTIRSSQEANKSEISINNLTKDQNEELNITAENIQTEYIDIKVCVYIDNNKTQEHIIKIEDSPLQKKALPASVNKDTLRNTTEIESKKNTGGHEQILADTLHKVKEAEYNTVKKSKTENSPATITEGENINYERVTNYENKSNLFTPKRKVGRPRKQKPKELDIISSTDKETDIKVKQEISHISLYTGNDLISKNVSDINVKREQEFCDSTINFTENNTSNKETFTNSLPSTSDVQSVNLHIRQGQTALPDSTDELIMNESNISANQEEEKHTDSNSRNYWFTKRRPRGRPRKHKRIEEITANEENTTNREILRNSLRDSIEVVNTENSPSTTRNFENIEEQNPNSKSENYLCTPPKKRGRKPKQKIIVERETQFLTPIEIPTPRMPGRPKTDNSIVKKSTKGKKRKRDNSNMDVTCAICLEVVKKINWPHHTIKHNFLCWHLDEPAIDLNDKKLVQYILTKSRKSLSKHFKYFTCDTCGDRKKSVLGFLSHLDVCQLTDEEREALMVTCDICKKRVLPQSLKYHMNTHKQSQIREKVIEKNDKNDDSNTTRSKRKAATKAVNLIQEVTNNELERSKPCREDILSGKKRYKKGSDPGSVFFNYGTILHLEMKFKQGYTKCLFPNCTFNSDDFNELKTHINSCTFLRSDDYVCKLCLHVEKNENAMQDHINSIHIGLEVFVSSSESDDDANEDEILPEIEIVKRRTSFPKQSSEYIKPTYKVAFLRKERRRTSNKVTSFLPALKWTAEFRKNNYYEETFKDILCLSSKWIPVPIKDQEEYMPVVTKSMSVNTCSVTYTFPNIQQRDHIWKEYDLYESTITNDTVNMFCGGPVWAFAWVPTPEYKICDQYLAVSVQKDFEATYKISESYSGKEVIQFWNFGRLQSNRKNENTPTLEFTIAHNHGMVWCMEWCPSGYYDLEEPNGDEELRKLGLLALACSDGNISIYSIGKPQTEDNNHNMFLVKPVYKLILQESSEQPLGQWKYQATRISWSKHSNHNIIAGGYTNGVVCLWDLTTTSPLLKSDEDSTIILRPYHSFQAHSSAVSALILYPLVDKGQRWLLTGSWDRTFKYWDLNNTSSPFSSFGKRGIITDGVWISHWLCSFFAFDDVFSFGHTVTTVQNPRDFAFKQCSALASNSVVMSMSSSDWASSIAQASLAGELTGSFPRTILMSYDIDKTLKCKRMLMSYNEIIDKTKKILERKDIMKVERKSEKLFIDKDDKSFTKYLNNQDLEPYVEEPTTYVEATKKYGLVFCDLEMEKISTFPEESFEIVKQSNRLREAPTELYPITSLNRVAWNPNKQAYLYIACGYQNGFVRLRCVRFMNAEGYSK